VWEAVFWGLVAGSTLVVGAGLALVVEWPSKVIGLVMAFGAGVLIASVAYDLIDDAAQVGTFTASAGGLVAGSLVFFAGDVMISRAGGSERKRSSAPDPAKVAAASGAALALGALLDGIPESAAIGVTLLEGGGPSASFVLAVALSNLPEGLSSSTGMRAGGRSVRHILTLWLGIALASGLAADVGYLALGDASPDSLAFVMSFAAGAILCMLASTMLPEAAAEGGPVVGLVSSAGFLVAVLVDRL
jgi:ZIP family zinc transporter